MKMKEKNLTVSEKLDIVASETAEKFASKKGATPGFAAGLAAKDEFWESVLDTDLGVADTVGLIRILPNEEGQELGLLLYNGATKRHKKCCAGILFDRVVGEGDYKPVDAKGLGTVLGGRLNKELAQVPGLLDVVGVFLGGWMHFPSAAAAETYYEDLLDKIFVLSKGVLFFDSIADYKVRAAEFLAEMEAEGPELHPELYTPAATKARKVFWARCGKVIESGNFPALLKDVVSIFSKDVAEPVSSGFAKPIEAWEPKYSSGLFPALLKDVADVIEEVKGKAKEMLAIRKAPALEGAWMANLFTGEFEFVPFTPPKKGGNKKPPRSRRK